MRPDAIIKTLEDAGFEARYVGGCVRDTLLDRPIHDWDIASQALPEDVLRLFPHCVPTGIRHGTVTVLLDGVSAEVTTYRLDGAYHDGRHPDGVRFVRSLAEDLARRDFTINAMAMRSQDNLVVALELIKNFSQKGFQQVVDMEDAVDQYEDHLGTYLVKFTGRELSTAQNEEVSKFLHTIGDFERISDHAVNLLDSAREMNEKKMVFSKAAASELHVFAGAVRDIINRSFDSFLQDDVELAKTVEPLEACIDDINVNVKSRHIERLTTGQCTIELGFVLTDISTNFERVSDHCSNIAVYQIQVPKDEYDAHEYLQNVKHQEHAEFDREEMAYEKQYRLPDVARVQTAKAGE